MRLMFKCYNCSREYSVFKVIEGTPVLSVPCPFCGAKAEVDLAAHRSTVETVMRGPSASVGTEVLPDVIPTRPTPPD